jgi:hypothetical protein
MRLKAETAITDTRIRTSESISISPTTGETASSFFTERNFFIK